MLETDREKIVEKFENDIIVTGIKILDKKGLKAVASVEVGPFLFNQFQVREHKGGLIVEVPIIHWVERSQHFWEKAVELHSEKLREAIGSKVLEKYYERMRMKE